MNQLPNSEQAVIQRLRAQLKSKEDDLVEARQQILQLQSSARLSHPTGASSLSIAERSSNAHGDIHLPVVPVSQRVVSAGNAGGKSHSRSHVDPRASHQYPSGDEPHPYAVKRPRTMSQQTPSSQKMDRAASNLSTRSAGPFTVPARHVDSRQHGISRPQGSWSDPADWFAAQEDASPNFVAAFSNASHPSDMDMPNPSMSVCGSMTSCPTYDNTAPMTRQNSQFDSPSMAGGVRMIKMGSQMSHGQDTYFPDSSQQSLEYDETSPYLEKPQFREDALFAVGSSLTVLAREPYASASPNDGLLVSPDMERSLSSTSVASAKSTSSSLSARAKVTLKQQNHRALNAPLKPKPSIDESKVEPTLDEKNDGKAVITKTKYVRPRQPKVFCELCDEHKEGFRGDHELRRHKDAKHQILVKKFICVDPQELGLPVNVQVVNPLSKCKACKAQKKYGAYYNAAAHLRRTHFKEKPSRCKNKNAGTAGGDEDKRGGKGGGDWPSMHELKNWMREMYVQQDPQQPKEDDDMDEDVDGGQPIFGDSEMTASIGASSSSGFDSPSMTNLDYGFATPLTMNVAGLSYIDAMPLSSADFSFGGPTNLPLAFNADGTAYSTIDQMHSLSSAVSSSATMTPLTVFNDAQQHHFDNVGYQYTA
ncbi:hypothetical protein NPX13_g10616 [Xylaria arbuscula]|uniref:DUF7896 domain-containing protein n=1 Tax=Xylaria arbuscula TaxID=114810 RepID=A0A9W8N4G0_9PEZI|nr:hypothetical protein NPX13_g10616 [Xylaria arbuscula]